MLKGIDVSGFNGSIDWSTTKNEIDFAIIRSSFGSDLPSQIDSFFYQNAQGCVKNGIPFGIYHFGYFINEEKARDEAEFALRLANEYKQYVKFIVLDIEEDTEAYAKRVGANPDWTKCTVVFLERIKSAGYTPVLYVNQNWLINKLNYEKVKNYKLWYAAPDVSESVPKKYSNMVLWQCSWTGKIDGINGNVDLDFCYDNTLFSKTSIKTADKSDDLTKFLNQAKTYIGKNGSYVCNTKLRLGAIYDWCAFAVSDIMQDCGFIGKYIKQIEGGAGSIPRESDGKYGTFFIKGIKTPEAGDLILFRYGGNYSDKYHSDHIGIVESVSGNAITTLEGNVDGNNSNWAATSTFKRKTRDLTDNAVYAFYRPNWVAANSSTETNTTTKKTSHTVSQIASSANVDFSVRVTSSNGVNIRNGASTSYDVLGAVPYGAVLTVTKQTSGGGYTWGLITYNGVTGWIVLNYTEKVTSGNIKNLNRKTVEQLAKEVINGKWGNGDERKKKLTAAGYDYSAVQGRVNSLLKTTTPTIKKDSIVKVKSGAKSYDGKSLAGFVYSSNFYVMELVGNRAVIGIDGNVTAAVKTSDLILVR